MAEKFLVKVDVKGEMIAASGVGALLSHIRPEWRTKSLIKRVRALLPVDPSSACQRLLNAAIFDLRKKIVIAGIDLAAEAARTNKLPPVDNADDVLEKYSTSNTLGLAYRMAAAPLGSQPRLLRSPRGSNLLRRNQPLPQSVPGSFGSIADANFVVDVANVAADSPLCNDKFIANFPIAFAEGQQPQYFHFSLPQPTWIIGGVGLLGLLVEDIDNLVDVHLA